MSCNVLSVQLRSWPSLATKPSHPKLAFIPSQGLSYFLKLAAEQEAFRTTPDYLLLLALSPESSDTLDEQSKFKKIATMFLPNVAFVGSRSKFGLVV